MCHAKLQLPIVTDRLGSEEKATALTAMIMHRYKINMVKFRPADSVSDQVPSGGFCSQKLSESFQNITSPSGKLFQPAFFGAV